MDESNFFLISLKQRSIFIKFWKSTTFFAKSANFFCFCFTIVYKEKIFIIEIEDGPEAPRIQFYSLTTKKQGSLLQMILKTIWKNCKRNFKWHLAQIWHCPIYNGTLKGFVCSSLNYISKCLFHWTVYFHLQFSC